MFYVSSTKYCHRNWLRSFFVSRNICTGNRLSKNGGNSSSRKDLQAANGIRIGFNVEYWQLRQNKISTDVKYAAKRVAVNSWQFDSKINSHELKHHSIKIQANSSKYTIKISRQKKNISQKFYRFLCNISFSKAVVYLRLHQFKMDFFNDMFGKKPTLKGKQLINWNFALFIRHLWVIGSL